MIAASRDMVDRAAVGAWVVADSLDAFVLAFAKVKGPPLIPRYALLTRPLEPTDEWYEVLPRLRASS